MIDEPRIPLTDEERDRIYRDVMSRMSHDPEPWRPSLFGRLVPPLTIAVYLALALVLLWTGLRPRP